MPQHRRGRVRDDIYFLQRFVEELALADAAADEQERLARLRACTCYRELLETMDGETGPITQAANGRAVRPRK